MAGTCMYVYVHVLSVSEARYYALLCIVGASIHESAHAHVHVTCHVNVHVHVCAIHASHLLHAVHFQYHAYPITGNISTCYLHVCTHTKILYYKLAAELATFMRIGLSWLEHMATFHGR